MKCIFHNFFMVKRLFKLSTLCVPNAIYTGHYYNDTYHGHAVDLIQSQLQQLLITTLSHQFERRLLETRLALEQQRGYVSDTLKRRREKKKGGRMDGWMDECIDVWMNR